MDTKKILLTLTLSLLLLTGCTALNDFRKNVIGCWQNDACRTEAVTKANDAGIKAEQVAGISGVPWAGKVARPAVGFTVLLFGLATLNKKFEKKTVSQVGIV